MKLVLESFIPSVSRSSAWSWPRTSIPVKRVSGTVNSRSGSHLVMGQPCSREDGDLLSSGDAVHAIDGRDSGLDHLLRVDAALRIYGLTW